MSKIAIFGLLERFFGKSSSWQLPTSLIRLWLAVLGRLVKGRFQVYVFPLTTLGTFLVSSGFQIPDFAILGTICASTYLFALGTYVYNDLTDERVDKINNKNKLHHNNNELYLPSMAYSLSFLGLAIVLAFIVNLWAGIISVLLVCLGILYSHPKTHLKDIFVVKTLVTAAGGGLAAFSGAVNSDSFSLIGMVSSIIVFLFWFVLAPLGDVGDINGDRAGGRKTIPVVLGVNATFAIIISVIVTIAVLVVLIHQLSYLNLVGTILGVSFCAFVVFNIIKISKKYWDQKMMKKTRTIMRFSVFSIQMVLFIGLISM